MSIKLINSDLYLATHDKDMHNLRDIIFDEILKGNNELPNILFDLKNMMSSYTFEDHIIQDHPSLWDWQRRFGFFENLWMGQKKYSYKKIILVWTEEACI